MGIRAGYSLSAGSTNTFLGYYAGFNTNQLISASNSLALGANTYTTDSNQFVYGDSNVIEHKFQAGNIIIGSAGKGLNIKEGTNARMGSAVLVGGTVTVSNTIVTANSRIMLTSQVDGGTVGFLRVSARTAATSFVITSSSATDTSTVAWLILEPA
jgi:hypothetical protein